MWKAPGLYQVGDWGIKLKDLALIILSSLLLVVSFPSFNLGFLAWVGLLPSLIAIKMWIFSYRWVEVFRRGLRFTTTRRLRLLHFNTDAVIAWMVSWYHLTRSLSPSLGERRNSCIPITVFIILFSHLRSKRDDYPSTFWFVQEALSRPVIFC